MRRVVARIGRAHGIRGEVSVEVRTDAPDERFVPDAVLYLSPPASGSSAARRGSPARAAAAAQVPLPAELTISRVRDHNGVLLLTFAEITDRTGAEALRNSTLEADIDPDEDDEDDAWYDEELAGLTAVSPSGEVLGIVQGLDSGAAQDRLIVRRPDGEDRMVPFVHQLVPEVDVEGGRVVIDAPPGLIDDLDDLDVLRDDEA